VGRSSTDDDEEDDDEGAADWAAEDGPGAEAAAGVSCSMTGSSTNRGPGANRFVVERGYETCAEVDTQRRCCTRLRPETNLLGPARRAMVWLNTMIQEEWSERMVR
jgi:hypothetical protein